MAEHLFFLNISVADPARSMDFFSRLGFTFNMQFTNEQAACMKINDKAYAMLLRRDFFSTFTSRAICDTATHTEGLFALSCDNRDAVDTMVNAALAAGGSPALPPKDMGFMYQWSFYDLDGHHWEVFWMDNKEPQQ